MNIQMKRFCVELKLVTSSLWEYRFNENSFGKDITAYVGEISTFVEIFYYKEVNLDITKGYENILCMKYKNNILYYFNIFFFFPAKCI